MGKVKIKRKSTFIDMTAMSDVTVLLLTFFMLTSTFLQKEPITVLTPSSVSEIKVPTMNLVTVLVSPEGQVFMSIAGDKDSLYSSEKMRAELLLNVASEYNKLHPSSKIEFTKAEVDKFSKINMFGVNIAAMKQWLGMTQEKMDEYIDPSKNPNAGIPIDMNENLEKPNEFQMWMRAAYNTSDENLTTAIKTGEGIAIKADKSTPYSKIQVVMDNLQTLKMNKFSLMTALKSEDE
ncbi:MAG: ExbD/TolR family protein [Muribaculaceae bacterium]